MDRRTLLATGLALGVAGSARAAMAAGPERVTLWPGIPPGGEGLGIRDEIIQRSPPGGDPDDIAWTHIASPAMTVARAANPNGAAVLLIPGGGYTRVAVRRTPSNIAQMFAARGITAFELLYRLPHDGWRAGPAAPLQDAQRAMRLIRDGAAKWAIDPARVAAIGFSAGGHLVGQLSARAERETYAPLDAADRLPARPIATGMFFPVVSMLPPLAHEQSRRELLGADPSEALATEWSLERNVPATMPPTFVCHMADDKTVKAANSLAMFAALQAARISSELVIGEKGGHGVPLLGRDGKRHVWFDLFETFATRHGWLKA
ncbi:acetyl esterase/lipase [Sphingomonas naasensis]|uniref:Alpha/beta hydrolase n=1 Tax=Sphingomonas naasensis TaxID=1344951 RepID=A0A4S1WUF3_9SPHN|nr:alpha/beta hydrolase [Sphingomonas naasensis]NIJ19201.1 acetyl esterase/lipase [Sphingomonas naasensis]TGX46385.1 alpha/beta hydrolase [Sphingomonas naasensis]